MLNDFPRIITLLRKERKISQKQAAKDLMVSQALLSHYEKGIRECKLDFVVRAADYYNVSCDYLLGRSPERSGAVIDYEDIADSDEKNISPKAGLMPMLNKKLICNSITIIFDLMAKTGNKVLIKEISSFFMLSVYRILRILHLANKENNDELFKVPFTTATAKADAIMTVSEAACLSLAQNEEGKNQQDLSNCEDLKINTQTISSAYPQLSSSLFNLVKNCESYMK